MLHKIVALFSVPLLLAGCGSNYGSSNNTGSGGVSYAGQAQGVYSGSSSNGYNFDTIILPDDKVYAVYGTASGAGLFVDGIITGQGTSGNNSYSANIHDFFNTGTITAGTVSATDTPGSSVSGTITESGSSTVTFSGSALPSSSFNYAAAASLSAITGAWSGALLDGMTTSVNIDSAGNFTGTSSGCSFSGSVTPDSSGKNFYDVTLTFGASPCTSPGAAGTGIAVYYLLSDGVTHQLVAAVTVGSSEGTVFFAQR